MRHHVIGKRKKGRKKGEEIIRKIKWVGFSASVVERSKKYRASPNAAYQLEFF